MSTYPYVEHDEKIKGRVEEEDDDAKGLRELKPWYLELRQPKYEDEVEEDPFQEEPHGLAVVLDDYDPVVHLPGHEDDIEAEGVEALRRRIDDVEGYQRIGRVLSLRRQRSLR